jgi:2'-5' RNA ligase
MKRTFIATKINPGEKLLQTYTKLRNELKNEKIKWVNSDHFHITLFFLGDTDEENIPQIKSRLNDIAQEFHSFKISLSGLGVFKNINKPRVLWAGIQQYETMEKIKNRIDEEMNILGFPPEERKFRPHLTLARLKWIEDRDNLKKLLEIHQTEDYQQAEIGEIIYYESILKQSGPVYKPLEKYTLSSSGG